MSHEDIPKNIAKNITELRKSAGMTQATLAEKLGYSDKSISKWERGEGMPDVICLKNMAELFGVTVDYFLESEHSSPVTTEVNPIEKEPGYVISHGAIFGVSLAGVFLLAAIVFFILKQCGISTLMPFVIACPVAALLSIIFNSIWGKSRYTFYTVTLFIWALLFLLSYILRSHGMWSLMLLGFPATLVVLLACRVRKKIDN